MTGFPPVAESPTPEPTFSSPPCTNLNFHCVFPIFFSLQFPPISTVLLLLLLSPPPPPPPPPVKVYNVLIVCIVMMKLCVSVLCCQVIQPDLHMVRTTAIHGWLTRLELYLCTDLLSCHSVFTILHFFPTLHYSMHPPKSNNFLDLTARGMCSMNI